MQIELDETPHELQRQLDELASLASYYSRNIDGFKAMVAAAETENERADAASQAAYWERRLSLNNDSRRALESALWRAHHSW